MADGVDPLLERIDQDLEECDASSLPTLASGPAAAMLDLGAVGMCGDEAPRVIPGGERAWCELAHGHPGWHQRGEQRWSLVDDPPLIEPRADQTRGWLARLFERWSR